MFSAHPGQHPGYYGQPQQQQQQQQSHPGQPHSAYGYGNEGGGNLVRVR